ncbi:histidine phosphatase family protein [Candidatus Saccharibacteria bacterium]|nr:MAG: histidine phosphatase family protein [Candidatus Saccharibacteria bacterium]
MTKQQTLTEVYLFRHAQTVVNTKPWLVGGRSNETELTPEGEEQARGLGRALLRRGIIPQTVSASTAKRAIMTARLSLAEMGLDIEPTTHEEILELSQGDAEGRPRVEVYTPEVLAAIEREGKDFKLAGGESMNEVGRRMLDWMNQHFTGSAAEPGPHFVFTHGGTIKYAASSLLDWPRLQTYETEIDNATANLFTHNGTLWHPTYLNRPAKT